MRLVNQTIEHVQRLITSPMDELGNAQKSLRYAIDLSRHCFRELKRDRANQMAAALTYRTIFSLMPMLVLAIVVLQAFQDSNQFLDTFKETIVDTMLPEAMHATDNGNSVEVSQSFAEARALFTEQIEIFFNKLANVNFGGIGAVGLLIFIYGATALLATVEKSFNMIFAVEEGRPWYFRITYYYTFITLGPIVLLAGQVLQKQFFEILAGTSWLKLIAVPLGVVAPVIAAWLLLLAIFKILPNTQVRWKPAAAGAMVGAVLWVISKGLFEIYLANTGITSLYGALGLVPLFLIWLFMTWFIVLFALELTYALQTLKREQIQQDEATREAKLIGDPLWLVPMMVHIGKVFGHGEIVSGQSLANTLGLPQRVVTDMGDVLEQAGLVNRVESHHLADGEQWGYSLAMPPSKLPMSRLLNVGREMSARSARLSEGKYLPGQAVLDQLVNVQHQAMQDMTLDQAINNDPDNDTPTSYD